MSGKLNYIIIGAIIIMLGIVGNAYFSALNDGYEVETVGFIDADNQQLVAQGASIYEDTCASCHGQNLEGQPDWRTRTEDGLLPAPPHDESGHTWHHPGNVLFEITKFGGQKNAPEGFISAMPGFDDILSDRDIWASLAFIKSRWPEKIRKRHSQMVERMKAN
jgi:mono/diheme cytochrome c family protein